MLGSNPCCLGCSSAASLLLETEKIAWVFQSLLSWMLLRGTRPSRLAPPPRSCFNPCCLRCSSAARVYGQHAEDLYWVSILVVLDAPPRPMSCYGEAGPFAVFQSLLSWMLLRANRL